MIKLSCKYSSLKCKSSRGNFARTCFILSILLILVLLLTTPQILRAGPCFLEASWGEDEINLILSKTLNLHLDPNLEGLSEGEQQALAKLLKVGLIFHELYLESRHSEALSSLVSLQQLHNENINPSHTKALLDLYRVMWGPIATTLDNKRVPFLPVVQEEEGKNVYPKGISREELDEFMESNPDMRKAILHLRSVVRKATRSNLENDFAMLRKYPVLDTLHPDLRIQYERLLEKPSSNYYYAVPYSVAYADRIILAYKLLNESAVSIEQADPAFARYLRLRARDLLTDNYEGGDAAWVTGEFTGNLNAQIGSYETYDDALFGVKSFFGLSIIVRDPKRSKELSSYIKNIQEIEDALPYESQRVIRNYIPVGIYNVIADFGQTRGVNGATVLPNEKYLSRQYGRTILIRANILENPLIFNIKRDSFIAATEQQHHNDLAPEGNLYHTVWHEIGHYMGVDQTAEGQDLDEALQDLSDLFEELKSDLVSIFAAGYLYDKSVYDHETLQKIYANGISRVLLKNRPRRDQPYKSMRLIQMNWFLDKDVLKFNPKSSRFQINYNNYNQAVTSLLQKVLELQSSGDRDKANEFVDQWTQWDQKLHDVVANNIRNTVKHSYYLFTYDALGEMP